VTIGTKSLLYGAHCFLLHPIFVLSAWIRLYGWPRKPPVVVAVLLHDLGYWGRSNMDGEDGKRHPEFGARLMEKLFDTVGKPWSGLRWYLFTGAHSRSWAAEKGCNPSPLCYADKLAFCLTPWWLYIPMATATGEIYEYMSDEAGRPVYYASLAHKRAWKGRVDQKLRTWIAAQLFRPAETTHFKKAA
jgi:hypothetical protein